jgi:hypothetical protein
MKGYRDENGDDLRRPRVDDFVNVHVSILLCTMILPRPKRASPSAKMGWRSTISERAMPSALKFLHRFLRRSHGQWPSTRDLAMECAPSAGQADC